jgi:Uma2 family endonuclease
MSSAAPPTILTKNDRVVLYNVSWQTYTTLRRNLGDSPIRLTYDGNNLEIMSPSRGHELPSRYLGRMIAMMAVELGIEIATGGSTTFQRADLERGLEPDECFWIANVAVVREKDEIDLSVDPPPDLAVEIDISPSRLDRPKIYAALRVPEIWRFDGENLCIDILQADGKYQSSETSRSFPFLPVAELARYLSLVPQVGETQCMRMFMQWLREQNFSV